MAARKEKKKRGRSFVACVAVRLKLVVLYYAVGWQARSFVLRLRGGKLVVCNTHVWLQACGFVTCVEASS